MTSQKKRKTARLVVAAISDLSQFCGAKGISLEYIHDFIANEYAVPEEDFKNSLRRCLNSGIRFGAIKKFRGKYLMGDVLRKHRRRRKILGQRKKTKKMVQDKKNRQDKVDKQNEEEERKESTGDGSSSSMS